MSGLGWLANSQDEYDEYERENEVWLAFRAEDRERRAAWSRITQHDDDALPMEDQK